MELIMCKYMVSKQINRLNSNLYYSQIFPYIHMQFNAHQWLIKLWKLEERMLSLNGKFGKNLAVKRLHLK